MDRFRGDIIIRGVYREYSFSHIMYDACACVRGRIMVHDKSPQPPKLYTQLFTSLVRNLGDGSITPKHAHPETPVEEDIQRQEREIPLEHERPNVLVSGTNIMPVLVDAGAESHPVGTEKQQHVSNYIPWVKLDVERCSAA